MILNKERKLQERLAAIVQNLRGHGHRLTPQRVAIIQALLESTEHPSAEDLYRRVSALVPVMSLATVYKTLDMLREIGEVVELPLADRVRYDGNPHPHVHLICEKCHAVIDWGEGVTFTVPEEEIAASGFRPHRYSLEVHGLCPRCQAEGEGRADNGRGP
ncbi:MAG: transcriptional repressor [Thermoflexia bacterium]|nr:MAG: transcriptional repressor [Thermoflexia bacterium]